MSTKVKTEPTPLERLKTMLEDRDATAATVDALEDELSDARAAVHSARDLAEADSMIARVTDLENQLAKAEARAQLAAEIVQRDAGALQEIALRELRADLVKRYGPKAAELDRAVISTTTTLLELFAERRELEAQASNEILTIPSTGMLSVNPRNIGFPERTTACAHFALQLAGLERLFQPVE